MAAVRSCEIVGLSYVNLRPKIKWTSCLRLSRVRSIFSTAYKILKLRRCRILQWQNVDIKFRARADLKQIIEEVKMAGHHAHMTFIKLSLVFAYTFFLVTYIEDGFSSTASQHQQETHLTPQKINSLG